MLRQFLLLIRRQCGAKIAPPPRKKSINMVLLDALGHADSSWLLKFKNFIINGKNMGFDFLGLLGVSVFFAACLQSATGIGYGVIAGPLFLVILNDNEAFQLSTIHNLAIALFLAPYVWKDINRTVLRNFLLGGSFGLLIGFTIYFWSSVGQLKFAAILMVTFVTIILLYETLFGLQNRKKNCLS